MQKSYTGPPVDEFGPLDEDCNSFLKSICSYLDVNGNPYNEEFHLDELMLKYQELLNARD